MKLNPDIIREVLLILEEEMTLDDDYNYVFYSIDKLFIKNTLKDYDHKEIVYNVKLAYDKGLIGYVDYKHMLGVPKNITPNITKITPSGHGFIEAIRKDSAWNKIKSLAKDKGFDVLIQIAIGFISK